MTDRLDRLVTRLRRLPAEQLTTVEELVSHLERGGLPPAPDSTTAAQRFAAQVAAASRASEVQQPLDWPHAPGHRISEHGTYIVTSGTLYKEHYFAGAQRLSFLARKLLQMAREFGWQLEAWAVFSNHYHFVGHSRPGAGNLNELLTRLHAETAGEVNRLDHDLGRQVWHNFWETRLSFEKSYLARLNYVHQNPVRHGLVPAANQYRWCSAAWFERTATRAQVKTIYGFKIDRVRVRDDFQPH